MKALEEKIVKEGTVLPGNILKVNSFLNHRIDASFIMEMGEEIATLFREDKPTLVLTIETSGIAIAMAAAVKLNVPLLFAKKHKSGNLSGGLYKTTVHSYTHGVDYSVVVEKKFLKETDRVLIVDDFLASGKALLGLIDIVNQSGATLVGASCAIEKGFQDGGDNLRDNGIKVCSLAIVDSMDDSGNVAFREQ